MHGNRTTGAAAKPLLRLLQLSSAALPVGAYAYSHGLEQAASRGWVTDEATAGAWIRGLLGHSLGTLDVPVFLRLCDAWDADDAAEVQRWTAFCSACREAAELVAEERLLGGALARVLANLGVSRAEPFVRSATTSYLAMFALGTVEFEVDRVDAASALLFSWAENQVACATRVMALGQLAAQRILSTAIELIPRVVSEGARLTDDAIGASAPGLGLVSALHETQYSRLFRS